MRNLLTVKTHCEDRSLSAISPSIVPFKRQRILLPVKVRSVRKSWCRIARGIGRQIPFASERCEEDGNRASGRRSEGRTARLARRRKEAGLPVKVQLVGKDWCASCGERCPARVKDTRRRARCRATSQNAIGEKDLAMELPWMIRRAGDSHCQERRDSCSQ